MYLIDDVASWLMEKLQKICGEDVYIHNFTHTPNGEEDDDDVNSQQTQFREKKPTYHLKNIVSLNLHRPLKCNFSSLNIDQLAYLW